MTLLPWIVCAALAIVVVVLARMVLARGRDRAENAPVHEAVLGRPSTPPAKLPIPSGESLRPPVRITSIRAPAAPMASAASARQAAKLAIARRDIRGAAEHYRDAGLIDEAVSLLVGVLGAPAEAAAMLAKRGDHERAADLYELAGRRAMAAREWARVAEQAVDPAPYLRRVRRLDPGLADALAEALGESRLDGFDAHAAPTRQIHLALGELPPPADVEESDESDDETDEAPTSSLADDEADRLAAAAADAAARALDSVRPDEEPEEAPTTKPRVSLRQPRPPASSFRGFLEEDDLDLTGANLDADVERAGVAVPLGELEAMTREDPCDLSNIEVFYRIGMARLAIGSWGAALAAFDAVEEASPGYRDADTRAENIRAWQLCLGSGRMLDGGRLEILGRFEERPETIVYRVRERARGRDVLLHVPRRGPEADYAQRAEQLALLDHPSLTRVLGGVKFDDGGFLLSETADGPTLTARMTFGPRPTVVDALRIASQLCEAIEDAGREAGEIDPADLRIVPGGLLKLMRWGWATATPEPSDPPAFCAPGAGRGPGEERDLVYAAGAILVYTLTGRADLARRAHEEDAWKEIHELVPYLPDAVKAVAKRATAAAPGDRFPSLKGLRLALRNLLRQVQRRASSMNLPAVRA